MSDVVNALEQLHLSPIFISIVVLVLFALTAAPIRGPLGAGFRWIFGRAERRALQSEKEKLQEQVEKQKGRADAERERDAYRERWLKEWERAEPREGFIAEDSNWHADLAANQPELHRQLPAHRTFQQFHAEWKRDRALLATYQGDYGAEVVPPETTGE